MNFISFMICAFVPSDTRQWRSYCRVEVWVIHGLAVRMISYKFGIGIVGHARIVEDS